MIQSFSDRDSEELFRSETNRRFHPIARVALRKLIQMNQAGRLDDLRVPPGNMEKGFATPLQQAKCIHFPVLRKGVANPFSILITTFSRILSITRYVTAMKSPVTPGEILLKEYLKPMAISQNAMARAIGVPPRAVNEIVLGKRAITPAMSIRFGAFFGQSDTFWHGIQVECDFRALARKRKQLVSGIQPATSLATAG